MSLSRNLRTFVAAIFAAAFVVLATAGAQAGLSFPPLSGRVVDNAGILSAETQQKLTAYLTEHEQQTGNQVVVATVKDLGGTDIADYGYQLGRAWGIGQKGKNNGAVIIISPSTHNVRIEVGYGLEGDLTDAQSKLIIENVMLPAFRKGDYDGGVLAGTVNVLRTIGGNPTGAESIPKPEKHSGSPFGGVPFFVLLIIFWVVFGRFLWPLFLLGGLGGGRGGGFGGFGGGSGGFGGGGFSGGGGSFGGGGASGSW